jgi:hypothetical protein
MDNIMEMPSLFGLYGEVMILTRLVRVNGTLRSRVILVKFGD